MSRRTDFTTEQWLTLLDAGPAIARAVASAAGSGGESERELETFVEMVQDAATAESGDTLLGDLVVDLQQRLASGAVPTPAEPYAEAIEIARRAGALLSVLADPLHAETIRDWLMRVAHHVAASTKEDDVLGIGGEQVSGPEMDVISEIADALGADPSAGASWESEGA